MTQEQITLKSLTISMEIYMCDKVDEAPAEEPQPSDSSNNEPNMTDEEFEAFMKKAQAFYDTQASENSDNSDDDDDFPSIEVHSND